MGGVWTLQSVRWLRATFIASLKMPVIVLEMRATERRWTLSHIVKLVECHIMEGGECLQMKTQLLRMQSVL